MVKQHIKRIVICAVLGAILGLSIYLISPKVYEGSTQILIATTDTTSLATTPEVASILQSGFSENVGTEISILRSRGIFRQAMKRISEARGDSGLQSPEVMDKLFLMYDVMGSRESRSVDIIVKANDPGLAADLANEIVVIYNELRQDSATESVSDAQNMLDEQIISARNSLGDAEKKLRDFKQRTGMVDLGSRASQLVSYQSTLMTQLDGVKADLRVAEAQVAATKKSLKGLPRLVTEGYAVAQSPIVQALENELAQYETQRTSLLRIYTPDSKRIKDIDDQISSTKNRIVEAEKDRWRQTSRTYVRDSVQKQFEDSLVTNQVGKVTLEKRVQTLTEALNKVNKQVFELPADETEMATLFREKEVLEAKYKNLRQALEELRYKSTAGMRRAKKLYEAIPQPKPVAPDLMKLLVLCTIGGTIVGFLFSVARESLRSTAQTSVELSQLLGLPVSATMPLLPPKQHRAVYKSLAAPQFKPFESFKFMAFSMLYSMENPPKRVLFTSIGGAVGCSTSASQFAIAASRTGKSTILMDCDLRHATITRLFDLVDKSGVREVINKMLLASDKAGVVYPSQHDQLSVVPAGSQGGEGLTDVPVGSVSAFLDTLQEQAGLIVIDAPPCDVVSDALRFAPYVDSVCLVASARSSKYQNIALAIDLLKRAGAKDVRLVMTHASPEEEAFSRKSLYVIR